MNERELPYICEQCHCEVTQHGHWHTPSPARGDGVDPDSEEANQVWDLVIEACKLAWPEQQISYSQSPIELIIDIINERDEALEKLKSATPTPPSTSSLLREAVTVGVPVVTRDGIPLADQQAGIEEFKRQALRPTPPSAEGEEDAEWEQWWYSLPPLVKKDYDKRTAMAAWSACWKVATPTPPSAEGEPEKRRTEEWHYSVPKMLREWADRDLRGTAVNRESHLGYIAAREIERLIAAAPVSTETHTERVRMVEALKQDAARYRWLRRFPTHFAHEIWGRYGAGLRLDMIFLDAPEKLDTAIDEALSPQPQEDR